MTFTVLTKRNREGVDTSTDVTVPTNPPESVFATILIDLVDMENPATRISLAAQVSSDGGANWRSIASGTWEGGPQELGKHGEPPSWGLTVDRLPDHQGELIRALLNTEPRTSVGVSVME